MKTAYALAFLGLLAVLSPAADARRMLQDSTTITDSDILNFALNLEVSKVLLIPALASRHVFIAALIQAFTQF